MDIDQNTKDQGYSSALMRGTAAQKKLAYGLVIAEVMKATENSGESLDGFLAVPRHRRVFNTWSSLNHP